MDSVGKLRFITDNVRFEAGPDKTFIMMNLSAGEHILRYLRGHLFRAPALVYCNASILSTKYVESYEAAGSTVSASVVRRYISSLAGPDRDDVKWRGFHVYP